MNTFPLFFKLEDRKVLIVGGGEVALRKADLLSRAGACITILAPDISHELQALLTDSKHKFIYKNYNKTYMSGARVIIAATDDETLNHQIHADATELNIPVNVVDTPHLCDFIFPAIIDRNPIVIGISSNGKAPVLARLLRARLETLIPQGYGKLAKLAGEFRSEVKAKIPTLTGRRQFWERAFEGQVSQLMFAGNETEAAAQLQADLDSTAAAISKKSDNADAVKETDTIASTLSDESEKELPAVGEVYIVGAGPGDPELLTFKALRLMQQADVVFYDALVSPQVLDLCRRDADKVFVGKKRSNHTVAQLGINELLVNHAKQGRRVVRLKGGDPFIFGRGGEEIESLRAHNVPYQVVPGITAANAAASYAGIPLTHRDHSQSVRFVTGFLKAGAPNSNFKSFLNTDETVVFYMGLHSLARLTEGLVDAGRSSETPIAIVSNASMSNQQVLTGTLATIVAKQEQAQLPTPALLIMGDVVSLHHDLAWYNLQNQQHSQNSDDIAKNWLREGSRGEAVKQPIDQQAHALSMVANLATQQGDGLEQLIVD
ncbi:MULTISPECIES: siroheme synthase CysG [Psychrobacter]|uniref:siroheme synthase CysG n=2 Tax=Moraxellaceae TaxID=468 RepID=UPI00086A8749|nr:MULTISPECIES: siroheme synthase CysG [Psychrobacter]MBA6244332.1 uroporphyrinogen-III C-methyltransferase [Psychrobacter sp. Urea-trap-18]MBA6286339.1 uroporphyrinogen-III C-methyltransferase [Psychrobacter sp. Urea-trap-16]MBA6317694.1 uroporphyrinogen-III C-methyltransferase [Psychrobacter sp. Urea-trap-20]MBA6335413.1 uroporphyrinogen-III C-methyltransferase [Psychrobacter sp. Urea-trap-19]OEH68707.1 MAG: uroporphyrinogen-III C-methyltransferase [Psychrobacter sp. B29-1]|tara:strand:+ start:16755 stop:18395 length:1641 start_codon:yes stop_codon:yes gene_type:complete